MPVVVVAAMTTAIKPALQKIAVTLPAGRPLQKPGQVLAFQIMTIDQSRLGTYMGTLDKNQVEDLKAALRVVWDL
jgi:mRNA-degrading endonuclease toxin of MazEF toxin-antitoxin module